MIKKARECIRRREELRRARARYRLLSDRVECQLEELARTIDHGRRYTLLRDLADTSTTMTVLQEKHPQIGDPLLVRVRPSMEWLLRLVADAEFAIACPGAGRMETPIDNIPGVDSVLDAAVAAGTIDATVLDRLYDAVAPVHSTAAAAVLKRLPLPGVRGDYVAAG